VGGQYRQHKTLSEFYTPHPEDTGKEKASAEDQEADSAALSFSEQGDDKDLKNGFI